MSADDLTVPQWAERTDSPTKRKVRLFVVAAGWLLLALLVLASVWAVITTAWYEPKWAALIVAWLAGVTFIQWLMFDDVEASNEDRD